MGKRNALPAVLVRSDLRDDLRCNITRGGKGMRFFDERARNYGAVLQHIFKVYQIAVVHVLREIVRVVEMDQTLIVRFYDIARQQNSAR